MTRRTLQRAAAPLGGSLVAVVLAGCGAAQTTDAAAPASEPAATAAEPSAAPVAGALPSSHVHGVARSSADGAVVLATHDGLFRDDDGSWTSVGPLVDLMGFAVAGPDHFYASGHPGPGTDLPNPVGLIESTDGGATWTPRSREGESDFHAMAVHAGGVVGFDGTLRATSDEETWTTVDAPVQPYALAASAQAGTVLTTSEQGPALSVDAGQTWTTLPDAPLLLLAAVVDAATLVGVTPAGDVVVSEDTGATWEERGSLGAAPQALSAARGDDGALEVLAVTDELLVSSDGGATFAAR